MQFEEDAYLKYCLIDTSDEKGEIIRKDGKFFVYNPEFINPEHSHNIVFVHGYNTDFFDAMETMHKYFDNLSPLIKGQNNFIGIYWPGDTKLNFSRAVKQATESASNFANVIDYIIKNSKAKSPSFSLIAHSLGNRYCAQAISYLKTTYGSLPVKNFIQLAPALDANCYMMDFKNIPLWVKNIAVYFSKSDTVLIEAYGIWGQFSIRKEPPYIRGGDPYKALGFTGPYGSTPSNVQAIDANTIAESKVEHGTYLEDKKLIAHVAQMINSSVS